MRSFSSDIQTCHGALFPLSLGFELLMSLGTLIVNLYSLDHSNTVPYLVVFLMKRFTSCCKQCARYSSLRLSRSVLNKNNELNNGRKRQVTLGPK